MSKFSKLGYKDRLELLVGVLVVALVSIIMIFVF